MKTVPDLMMEVKEEFSVEMLNEDACRNWFLRKFHHEGVFCPECSREITSEKKLQAFWAMRRVSCPFCNRRFSAVTGTVLSGIGIEFRALYILLFMVGHGAKANNISKQLGISNGAAYVWANRAKGKAKASTGQGSAG